MEAILEILSDTFERLQSLNIQPTMHNVTVLQTSLSDIQRVYNIIRQSKKELDEAKPEADKPEQEEQTDAER